MAPKPENDETPEKDGVDSGLREGDGIRINGDMKNEGSDLALTELVCVKENGEAPEKDYVDSGLIKGDEIVSKGENKVKRLDLASTELDCGKENGEVPEKDNVNLGLSKGDGIRSDGDDNIHKEGLDLASIEPDCDKDSLADRKNKAGSERVDCGEDVDACADANADTARPKIGRGRRGRKRKRAESTDKEKGKVKSGLEKSDETNSTSDNEKQSQVPSLTDTECVEDSLATFERKTDTKRNASEDSEHMECNGEADDNAHDDNLQDMPKIGRGKRGRKRKMVERAVCNGNDGTHKKKKVNKAFLLGKSEVVARILRSRTMVTSGVEKMVDGGLTGGVVDGKGKKEASHLKIIEMEKGRSAQSVGRQKKKLKGRRGRPPKVQGISGPLKATDHEKQNEMGSRKNGDQLDSEKVTRGSEFVAEGKNSELVSVSHSNYEGEKISVKQSKRNKHGEGGALGMSKSREKKRSLTERIKAMLNSAGWTIEYRRRHSKENYFDAVYVTPQGSGHWSVTLAYNILKKQVEDGKADSRAISAFTPIPEEEFSILLRKTDQKPRSDKGIPRKQWVKKKHAMEKMNNSRHKHKEKQGSAIIRGDKFSNRRTKLKSSDREQEKSANKLQKGMQRSNKKRYALLVRDSKKLGPDSEGFVIYNGKRSLLSWMIDLGTLSLNEKVQYKDGTSGALLEGRITRDGIQCDCCNETFAFLDFESHAGSKLSQPFQNIYVESGSSLLRCLQDSWNKHEGSECTGFRSVVIDGDDPNDDTCNKCGDGGDLICCDGCPSTFHQKCLNMQNFPSGDWHCVYCSCKFCGMADGNMYERDQNCDTSGSTLLTCRLCEEKYHQVCIHGKDSVHFDSNCPSFCGKKCQEVFEHLQELLWVKHQLEEGFSWTLVQHSDVDQDISLSGVAQKVESNSKLAVAFSIMDECFLPIIDQRSGTNMIRNVVYSCGSNFNRLNYSGFFTAILERGDEIISVASIRIHGNHLAEMPFIGTRHIYRRQGMCRRLLNGIEAALCSLNVEKLVIPAISELLQTWTSVFGFMPLEESNRKEMKHMNMIVFPGIDMLQKPLSKQQFSTENLISTAAGRSIKSRTEHQTTHEGTIKSECATSEMMKFQEPVTIQNFSHSGVTDGNEEFERKDTKDSEVFLGNHLELDGMHTSEKIHKHENVHSGYTSLPSYENTNGKGNEGADGELIGGVKSVNHICSTLDEDSVQLSAEIKTQPQDLDLIPGCNILGKNFINDSIATNLTPSNVKCEPELGNPASLSPRALDVVNDCEAYDGNCSSHLRDFPGSQELKDDASVHNNYFPLGGVFNDVTKPNFEASYISNGLCKSSECQSLVDENDTSAVNTSALDCSVGVSQVSCVVTGNIHDLKEEFTVAHTDSLSLDVDSLPKRPQMSTNCAKESKSPSQVDHASVKECDSEPPCNSSSSPALTRLCNASGIPEVGSCRILRSGKLC